jgi:hypothetical protein
MARTFKTHALFVPDDIYDGIKKIKAADQSRFTARLKSVNAYVCEILNEFVRAEGSAGVSVTEEAAGSKLTHTLRGRRVSNSEQRKTA